MPNPSNQPTRVIKKPTGYIKVTLDYAPTTNGKKMKKWCEEHNFDFFGVGRRAWCSQYSTYMRDALGVAYTTNGESFLFYDDDVKELLS